jgi:hypothetical protein
VKLFDFEFVNFETIPWPRDCIFILFSIQCRLYGKVVFLCWYCIEFLSLVLASILIVNLFYGLWPIESYMAIGARPRVWRFLMFVVTPDGFCWF